MRRVTWWRFRNSLILSFFDFLTVWPAQFTFYRYWLNISFAKSGGAKMRRVWCESDWVCWTSCVFLCCLLQRENYTEKTSERVVQEGGGLGEGEDGLGDSVTQEPRIEQPWMWWWWRQQSNWTAFGRPCLVCFFFLKNQLFIIFYFKWILIYIFLMLIKERFYFYYFYIYLWFLKFWIIIIIFSKFLVIVFILSTPKTPFEHALDFLLHDFEMAGEILF